MARPVVVNQAASHMAFYIQRTVADDQLYFDYRVKVTRVVDGADNNSDADILIDWQEVNRFGTVGLQGEMSDAYIAKFYAPQLRCAVVEILPGVPNLRDMPVLMHGYIDAMGLSINGAPAAKGTFMRRSGKVRSIFQRSGRQQASTIQGRYMLTEAASAAIDAENPPSTNPFDMPWATMAKRVESLPAIFNFQGKPNRLARPVLFKAANAWNELAPIHLFTYDGDPNAEYWTFLQALQYLVMAYLPYGLFDQVGPGGLFTTLSANGPQTWWDMTEAESNALLFGPVNTGWRDMMVRNANNLSVEGMNLIEALLSFGQQSGLHFHEQHSNKTQNGVMRALSDLDFWVEDQKPADVLHLEKKGSHLDAAGNLRSISNILSTSNVQSTNIQHDFGSTIARTEIVGGREWWVVTSELLPLWEIDDRWDDVSQQDADTYRTDAYSEPFVVDKTGTFFRRYHPHGSDFNLIDYDIVGRLWGIDPAGEIDFLLFNRANPPYDNYETPYVIPVVPNQVRRRRMIDHPAPKNKMGRRQQVIMEISLDGGDTWSVLESAFKLIRERSAFYFKQPNLLTIGQEIIEGLATVENYYDAYLQRALRLRATFAIELDERLIGIANGTITSPLGGTGVTKMVLKKQSFHSMLIDLSTVDPLVEAVLEETDDADSIARYAKAVLAERVVSKFRGNPTIPWIESDRYPIGTPIQGIVRTPGGNTAIKFGGSSNRGRGYPHVIAKIYDVGAQTTSITLRDYSLRKGLSGP